MRILNRLKNKGKNHLQSVDLRLFKTVDCVIGKNLKNEFKRFRANQ